MANTLAETSKHEKTNCSSDPSAPCKARGKGQGQGLRASQDASCHSAAGTQSTKEEPRPARRSPGLGLVMPMESAVRGEARPPTWPFLYTALSHRFHFPLSRHCGASLDSGVPKLGPSNPLHQEPVTQSSPIHYVFVSRVPAGCSPPLSSWSVIYHPGSGRSPHSPTSHIHAPLSISIDTA